MWDAYEETVMSLSTVLKLEENCLEGGTETQRRIFCTALYRCFERMVDIAEDGRYYSAFDHQIHQDPRSFYVDNW
jgi:putative alpha-1,2-mannosidase